MSTNNIQGEKTMRLADALINVPYCDSWGVYAIPEEDIFTQDSTARYGEKNFENGGLHPEFQKICNGTTAGDFINEWLDDDGCLVYG